MAAQCSRAAIVIVVVVAAVAAEVEVTISELLRISSMHPNFSHEISKFGADCMKRRGMRIRRTASPLAKGSSGSSTPGRLLLIVGSSHAVFARLGSTRG